ncbi:hypothetical protein HELRODRAFT_156021 [Helobdella robusta]|uniref:Radial spoke head protein 9 homolog n=1 Tax=Helobdella robusta TaxID=6412 RepID=T1ELQ7_HELRO|nr:hypothetical protein HELRODRAFT_156021 [Helobdella robusta]ESN96418.1 hypothetical protein HELRODRAFT_156021 [Helobdella robusta]
MNFQTLTSQIEHLGNSGIILSPEQKALLEVSLPVLKNDEKLTNLQFWGKIRGVNSDYFITKGFGNNYFGPKRYFYSQDCLSWGILNPPDKEMVKKSKLVHEMLTGDPTFVSESKVFTQPDEQETEEIMVTMKEEDRLACVIQRIEKDVFIVPRKAFIKLSNGDVIPNRSFEGLEASEACQFYNFMHFRKERMHSKVFNRPDIEKSIDFMDTIEDDIPKGSWSLQMENGETLVTLKSLLWLGLVFYHVVGTKQFGCSYFGYGDYNIDLPFML